MTSIACALLTVSVALSAAAQQPADAAPTVAVIEELPGIEYNLECPLYTEQGVVVRFDEVESGDRLELRIGAGEISLFAVTGEREEPLCDPATLTRSEDGSALVTLRRRAESVSVLDGSRNAVTVFRPAVEGTLGIVGPETAFLLDELYFQP